MTRRNGTAEERIEGVREALSGLNKALDRIHADLHSDPQPVSNPDKTDRLDHTLDFWYSQLMKKANHLGCIESDHPTMKEIWSEMWQPHKATKVIEEGRFEFFSGRLIQIPNNFVLY